MAQYHSDKHINAAIEYAISKGWRFEKSGPRSHCHSKLYCPAERRGGHIVYVRSTPRTPFLHAQRIREDVEACEHTSSAN